MFSTIRIVLLASLVAACTHKASAPAEHGSATAEKPMAGEADHDKGQMGKHEMPGLSPELAKFHDVLAPHWHAAAGPDRMKGTCDAIGDFKTNADALTKATPSAGMAADAWATSTKSLVDAVAALEGTCNANDAAGFDAAFTKVHEGFHALLGGGMHHDEHEGHEGSGEAQPGDKHS